MVIRYLLCAILASACVASFAGCGKKCEEKKDKKVMCVKNAKGKCSMCGMAMNKCCCDK